MLSVNGQGAVSLVSPGGCLPVAVCRSFACFFFLSSVDSPVWHCPVSLLLSVKGQDAVGIMFPLVAVSLFLSVSSVCLF